MCEIRRLVINPSCSSSSKLLSLVLSRVDVLLRHGVLIANHLISSMAMKLETINLQHANFQITFKFILDVLMFPVTVRDRSLIQGREGGYTMRKLLV